MLKIIDMRCEYRHDPIGIDAAQPRLSWQLTADERGAMQSAYRVQVARDSDFADLVWDTGRTESDQSLHLPYAGDALHPRTRYSWRVMVWDARGEPSPWSETACWETGLGSPEAWQGEWISAWPALPLGKDQQDCPYFRKAFSLRGPVASARLYATALGVYELRINGERVSDHLFAPGWTSYEKRLQYQTYDVTAMLRPGENALGALLGNGWYFFNLQWPSAVKNPAFADRKALLVQLAVTYADGSSETIVTDGSWRVSMGPVLTTDIFNGETIDARLAQPGWDAPGFDDAAWTPAVVLDYPKHMITTQESEPVRIIETRKPQRVFRTPTGKYVLDFGQNLTGWVRVELEGPAGAQVILRHSEILDAQGEIFYDNLRKARQTTSYTLRGQGLECFEPHFTYQGFRYAEVVEYPGRINPEAFTACVIHTDMPHTCDFTCSNEQINQLQHNIWWSQRDNFLEIPTDCPQRDERLGWTADAQIYAGTACYNMNAALFFEKWLADLRTECSAETGMPAIIPNIVDRSFACSSGWGDAATIVPWTVYVAYGDRAVLEKQYDSMKAWVEYIRRQGDNPYLWNTGFHYGDWLGLDAKPGSYEGATAKDFIATAFYAYSTSIVARAAAVLGRAEDVQAYTALHRCIVDALRREFLTPAGRLCADTQTAHVLALRFGLLDEQAAARAAVRLRHLLAGRGNHLCTGFMGTPYICHALSDNGMTDLAYQLLLNRDYPSWLYAVERGATTMWEHWDSILEDGSFWSRDMNSFNHYAYGSVGEWMYKVVAGLRPDEARPGFKHSLIAPKPGGQLTFARIALETLYGPVRTGWEQTADGMILRAEIPANTTATIVLPGASLERVLLDGRPVEAQPGVQSVSQGSEGVLVEVGSGKYEFTF